jgi:hypothetical protein
MTLFIFQSRMLSRGGAALLGAFIATLDERGLNAMVRRRRGRSIGNLSISRQSG